MAGVVGGQLHFLKFFIPKSILLWPIQIKEFSKKFFISKQKNSNETLHLGFYLLLNVFSYRKHISSKSNTSVLTIYGKSRKIKIIAPSPTPPILLSTLPFHGILSIFPEGYFIMTLPPILIYFSGTPTPLLIRLP